MLSVLIVNWNTCDQLRACLLSLRADLGSMLHEIIVIDNASTDGSPAMVRGEFPEVALVAESSNLGYARGNNLAYAAARGQWLWLLNPDTEVELGAAATLKQFLNAHPQCGAVASVLIDARDGRPQRSCRTFPSPAALWIEASGLARAFPRSRRYGFYRMGWWSYGDVRRVDQPMASSLMLRREAIEAASGGSAPKQALFDEQFPIYFNDVDLCRRLLDSGWEIWFTPLARVKHWGGASTNQVRPAMIAASHDSLARYYRKHYRGRLGWPLYMATQALIALSGAARYHKAHWVGRRIR